MIYILLSVLSSTLISVIFKSVQRFNIRMFDIILINYIIACLLGFILSGNQLSSLSQQGGTWLPFAALIGVLFIIMFYLIGLSTHKAGISVTTIATRMAVIIPVIFSIVYYNEDISLFKVLAFLLAFASVILSVLPNKFSISSGQAIYLPIIIFFGAGLVDSIVKYIQQTFLTEGGLPVFSTMLFGFAGIIGFIVFFIKGGKISALLNRKVLIFGTLLGFVNFGSIYFFVNALNTNVFDSSVIFGINHIGIITFSVLLALLLFKERLKLLNWIGVIVALISLLLLSRI